MQFLTFILFTVLDLYIAVLLLRVWMQWARCDFYNPFAQFIVKITQPIVRPLRRVIPAIGSLDTASIVVAYILVLFKLVMQLWFSTGTVTFLTLFIPIGLIELLTAAGKLVFWLVLARALLSWISQGRNPIDYVLMQLTEPLMAPIRRIIPTMGGLDFSAMIVILILYALNYLRADVISWLIQ
ncbi:MULTISPECIES: YggT family protein [Photorhabdus]|uniref:YggT family protein n=2 Tax=Photorhabdus asymbiotica TaxID=291112 RepID=A0ABX9SMI8_9GAMM|nr:YggT family protein [Photorhabdus asymbiotica]RKS58243.1 YggT family protein [Photorhabdus asymbiotica]CAQ85370.1 Similar to putative resistance protein YggT [Photorhabdus asymbiotica]CAR67699.1 Similar to putative resistance protein YggT [Photorhabdus asymbiotica subsp. asymbiotica ATCC 43949]